MKNIVFLSCLVMLGVSGILAMTSEDFIPDDLIEDAGNVHDAILEANEKLLRREVSGDDENADDEINAVNKDLHLLEGDILGVIDDEGKEKRSLIRNTPMWPRTIPYIFTTSLTSAGRTAIYQAFAEFSSKTCLRFKQRTNERNYLRFIKGGGCYSYIGNINRGGQPVSIGKGCEHKGLAIHEIMHALGFFHEQSRPDRDQYVTINFSNVSPGMTSNFNKHIRSYTQDLPYDYASVLHYGRHAFTKNGYPTIVAKNNPNINFGQRSAASNLDIQGINRLYCGGGAATPGKR